MKVLEIHVNPASYTPGLTEVCVDCVVELDEEEEVAPVLEQLKASAHENGFRFEAEESQHRRWLIALIGKVASIEDYRRFRLRGRKTLGQS